MGNDGKGNRSHSGRDMEYAQVQLSSAEALRYDADLRPPPGPEWFDRSWWARQGRLEEGSGGRGGIAYIDTPVGPCALRHCHRGGLAARFSDDRYLWMGAARVRSFVEFELLAYMTGLGLPVPAPVAARFQRQGPCYRADLITRRIAAGTLAECLRSGRADAAVAAAVGSTVARFHAAGIAHADLNAHNILVGDDHRVWLLDFDRGRLRRRAASWQQASLARLQRSVLKVAHDGGVPIPGAFWEALRTAHDAHLARYQPS